MRRQAGLAVERGETRRFAARAQSRRRGQAPIPKARPRRSRTARDCPTAARASATRSSSRSLLTKMAHEIARFLVSARIRDADGALLGRFPRDALGAAPRSTSREPATKWESAFGGGGDEIATQRRRKRRTHQQSLARLGVFAETLDDARQNALAEIGVEIASERDHRLPLADFRERGGDARRSGAAGAPAQSGRGRRRSRRNRQVRRRSASASAPAPTEETSDWSQASARTIW